MKTTENDKSYDDYLDELDNFSKLSNYLDALFLLLERNNKYTFSELSNIDTHNKLIQSELTYLFGLWLKNKDSDDDKIVHSTSDLARIIHQTLDNLHLALLGASNNVDKSDIIKAYRESPEMVKETIFYSGTGVYDTQLIDHLIDKYKYDETWIKSKYGFNLNDMIDFFTCLRIGIDVRMNLPKQNGHGYPNYLNISNHYFNKNPKLLKVAEAFSVPMKSKQNGTFRDIGDANEFKINPIWKEDSNLIVPLQFALAESIYDSPYYWMLKDETYRDKALNNRGNVAEELTFTHLGKVFSTDELFIGLEVELSKGKRLTDLDVCVIRESTMIIFQVKSKRLTQLTREGDIKTFQKDFQKAVGQAHHQANVAIPNILNNTCKVFDRERKLIDISGIKDIVTACVVLDPYPAISLHTMMHFIGQKVRPIAMSVFDLEVIVSYLNTPEKLTKYLTERGKFGNRYHADTELTYLGFYLNKGGFEERKDNEWALIDTSYAKRFDRDFFEKSYRKYEIRFRLLIGKVGRNDKCICMSGKKYKNCCLRYEGKVIE